MKKIHVENIKADIDSIKVSQDKEDDSRINVTFNVNAIQDYEKYIKENNLNYGIQ